MTIAGPDPGINGPAVRMDAAGNVIAVWESVRTTGCTKYDCSSYESLGVFMRSRPAGGRFGAPVRLAAPRTAGGSLDYANPQVAMNRNGDWLVVMHQGRETAILAGHGAGPIGLPTTRVRTGLPTQSVALDEAGNATFGGTDADGRPVALVRNADGSFGELSVLDTVRAGSVSVSVGPQGQAVASWSTGERVRYATRPAGGQFGAPADVPPYPPATLPSVAPRAVTVDGADRITMLFIDPPTLEVPPRLSLRIARGTIAGGIGVPTAVSDVSNGWLGYAMNRRGDAVLEWLAPGPPTGPFVPQLALARDGGPFSAPRALTFSTLTSAPPVVAIDADGRVAMAWTEIADDTWRLRAAAFTSAGVEGPTLVATTALDDNTLRASATRRQVLRVQPDATIRPRLRCVSPGPKCRGSLRIDARPRRGRRSIGIGATRFVMAPGSSRRVTVHLTRAARRAARRRGLTCVITTTTKDRSGRLIRDRTSLTLRRDRTGSGYR